MNLKENPFYLNDDDIEWVENTLDNMSLDEKIGQLFCPIGISDDREFLKNQMLSKHIGGMLYRPGKAAEIQSTHRFLQENSKIPLLIAANLEDGGTGIATDGTFFGKQMQVAAVRDKQQAYRLGKVSCGEGAAVGCNWAFAPVVDIDMNFRNPITNVRTYGDNADTVLSNSLEYLRAANECGVAVAVKHFPGDGVDERDQHLITTVNSLSCEEWDKTYGKIYKGMIDAGALTFMAAHIAMPAYQKKLNPAFPDKAVPATLSPELLKGLLRGKLGFNGMVVTDATPMAGFTTAMEREKAVPYAIASGCDMFLFNKDFDEDLRFMRKGCDNGIISDVRLNEAVTRILATKAALKLHIKQKNGTLVPQKEALDVLKCEEHEKWARECADKSVTLVKDTQNLLPVTPEKHKRVLFELLGETANNERITKHMVDKLAAKGFEITIYEPEKPMMPMDTVAEFKNKYDLVLYVGNIENLSNKTVSRINWHTMFGQGNNVPWFVNEVPALFISLANPYHLLDVAMIKTYINCYSNSEYVMDAVIEKILGESEFKGASPVDPFCGRWDTKL